MEKFKLAYFISFSLLSISGCTIFKKQKGQCALNHSHLRYKIVKDGFIGKDAYARIDLCFKEKRKEYEGISIDCLIALLGKPISNTNSEMTYYLGVAKMGRITGGVTFIIQAGKVVGSKCFIV